MKKLFQPISVLLLLGAGPAVASGTQPSAGDPLHVMLATFYKGDFHKTDACLKRISARYNEFLEYFTGDDYCTRNDSTARGCEAVATYEKYLISQSVWSRSFGFDRAEFNQAIGQYNFEKAHLITGNYICKITLQVTADLRQEYLLNQEFYVKCNE